MWRAPIFAGGAFGIYNVTISGDLAMLLQRLKERPLPALERIPLASKVPVARLAVAAYKRRRMNMASSPLHRMQLMVWRLIVGCFRAGTIHASGTRSRHFVDIYS